MFLNYLNRECKGCGSISEAICELDRAIARDSTSLYNSYAYLSKMSGEKRRRLRRLIHYRGILMKLVANPSFYPSHSYKSIISKVKTLI